MFNDNKNICKIVNVCDRAWKVTQDAADTRSRANINLVDGTSEVEEPAQEAVHLLEGSTNCQRGPKQVKM